VQDTGCDASQQHGRRADDDHDDAQESGEPCQQQLPRCDAIAERQPQRASFTVCGERGKAKQDCREWHD
jgi:hypothetical protein